MIRFSKDQNEGKIWLYIPSALLLVWKGEQRERQLVGVLIFLLLLSVPTFLHSIKIQKIAEKVSQEQLLASAASAFSGIELEAESAYVFDIESEKVLYTKNEEKTLPLASLTKVMTALVALETLSEDTVVEISKEALDQEGDNGLYLNEKWRLGDLVKFMLLASPNDAARAIALASHDMNIFIARMNEKALELGLLNTKFFNETGLDISEKQAPLPVHAGAYGTVRDMTELFVYAIKKYPEIFRVTAKEEVEFTSLSGFVHRVENTNILTTSLVNIIASKTGLTTLAGGNLITAFDAELGRPVVAVVLGSTEEGRFSDIEKLISATVIFTKTQKHKNTKTEKY